MSWLKSLVVVVEVCASVYISRKVFWYFAEKYFKKKKKERGLDYINTNRGYFFGLDGYNGTCLEDRQPASCRDISTSSSRNYNYLLDLIKSAKSSVDVCIYIITIDDMALCLVDAKNKGLNVRVIADADMALSKLSQVQMLAKHGVKVKFKHSKFIMHHKFVVIDKEILIMGSLNFTKSALESNWESVVVTSMPKLVEDFSRSFEKLWLYMSR